VICLASFSAFSEPASFGVNLVGWLVFVPTDTATGLECAGSNVPNFYVLLAGVLSAPILLDLCARHLPAGWFELGYWAANKQTSKHKIPLWKKLTSERVSSTVSWATWFALSPAAVRLCTQAFVCEEFKDLPGSYLKADYGMRCDTGHHLATQTVAGVFLVYVGLLLPLRLLAWNAFACLTSRTAHREAERHIAETNASVASARQAAKPSQAGLWSETKQTEPTLSAVETKVASILNVAVRSVAQSSEQQEVSRGSLRVLIPNKKSMKDRLLVALGFSDPTRQSPALDIALHPQLGVTRPAEERLLSIATSAVIVSDLLRPLMRDLAEQEIRSVLERLEMQERLHRAGEFIVEHTLVGFAQTRHHRALSTNQPTSRAAHLTEEDRSFLQHRVSHSALLQSRTLLKSPLSLRALCSELAWMPRDALGMSSIGLSDPSTRAFAAREATSMLCANIVVALVTLYDFGSFPALVAAILVTTAHSMFVAATKPLASLQASLFEMLCTSTIVALLLGELIALARANG